MPATKRQPETTLLRWTAPSRPFQKRSKDFYVKLVTVASLLGLILFLIEGLMPVLLLISLIFLFYVMSTIKPDDLDYEITNFGIKLAGKLSPWENMTRFWFTHRLGSHLLIIETTSLPGRLELVISPKDQEKLTKALSPHLLHEEAPPSFLDKAAAWSSKFLPE